MKRTYTILTITDNDTKMEFYNHFVTLSNRLTEIGAAPHIDPILSDKLVHQDAEGNEVLVFASSPMAFATTHRIKPASYINAEDPEQMELMK